MDVEEIEGAEHAEELVNRDDIEMRAGQHQQQYDALTRAVHISPNDAAGVAQMDRDVEWANVAELAPAEEPGNDGESSEGDGVDHNDLDLGALMTGLIGSACETPKRTAGASTSGKPSTPSSAPASGAHKITRGKGAG
eukprot:9501121-Pyramimonas_sp.AAC.1